MAPREGALMTIPSKGMDHDLYDFLAMPTRGSMSWPDGARMAMTVLLHLEYWELQPPEGSVRDNRFTGEYGFYYPEYRPFTQREYGNRIGIFRVLKALDAFDFNITVAANAAALVRYPELVQALQGRGCEFIAHGEKQTQMLSSTMSEDEERASFPARPIRLNWHWATRPTAGLARTAEKAPERPSCWQRRAIDTFWIGRVMTNLTQ